MASINQSQIERCLREIASLQKDDAREAKKEADLSAKLSQARLSASRTKNASTIQSKLREADRAASELAAVGSKRADIAAKIASKTSTLHSYEGRKAQDDARASRRLADEQKRLIREREMHDRHVKQELRNQMTAMQSVEKAPSQPTPHDFFISHASEDKEAIVRDLANALRERGAKVWYDEFTLKVGDSLRRSIDLGLASSRFGVVVFSEHFFRKEWPNRELDGLVARETQGQTRVLPIWHKVSKDEVARYSPTLADKVAISTALKGIEEIADELMTLLR